MDAQQLINLLEVLLTPPLFTELENCGGKPLLPGSDGPRGDTGTDKLSTQNHCPKLKSKQYHDKTVNFLPEIDPILFPKNICQSGRERKKRGFVPTFTFFNLFMALAA